MRHRTRVWLAMFGAVVLVVLLATNLPVARTVLALAVCLLLPGLGWARKMRVGDLGDTIALAIALSICTTVAVGMTMAVSGSRSPGWGLAALGAMALAGFVPTRLLLQRAAAAIRLRIGESADTSGARAETQDEATASQAPTVVTVSEPWVEWYADVNRRAEEARAREAAAKQAAVDEWISWYRRTGLLTTRSDRGADEMRIRRGAGETVEQLLACCWTDQVVGMDTGDPVRIRFSYSTRLHRLLELLQVRPTEVGLDLETDRVTEMAIESWIGLLGPGRMGSEAMISELEYLLAVSVGGNPLPAGASTPDRNLSNDMLGTRSRRWHVGNLVLMGDVSPITQFMRRSSGRHHQVPEPTGSLLVRHDRVLGVASTVRGTRKPVVQMRRPRFLV